MEIEQEREIEAGIEEGREEEKDLEKSIFSIYILSSSTRCHRCND